MNGLGLNEQQLQKIKTQPGFIAALDQSGGSTPTPVGDRFSCRGSRRRKLNVFTG